MRATRRRPSTTEHGHAVSIRGYQSDPWSVERPLRRAPRSYPALAYGGALTGITPYQLAAVAVSSELVSKPTEFPANRENRGNFLYPALWCADLAPNSARTSGTYARIP